MKSNFICIGHRGTRKKDFDENTTLAFEKALKYGADFIEFDIRKTKDNQLIILHDSTLNRTTNGLGQIQNFTLNEILNFKTKIKKKRIPLFLEVLDKFKGKIKFLIELKGENVRDEVLRVVSEKKLLNDCVFSGRKLSDLKLIKKKFRESKICYNITKGKDLTLEDFINFGNYKKLSFIPDMISLRSNLINSDFIEICHRNDIIALSWDFIQYENPLKIIKDLIGMGIDGILFDNYENIPIIKQWLKEN
ncbi:MAG: glycerophosphodiester phosphodiesterase [Promethearchaeota archaeon]